MTNRVLSLVAICTAYSMQPPLYPQIKPFLRHIYDGGGFGCMKKRRLPYKGVNLRIRPAQAQRHTFRHLVLLQGLLQPSRRIQTVS